MHEDERTIIRVRMRRCIMSESYGLQMYILVAPIFRR